MVLIGFAMSSGSKKLKKVETSSGEEWKASPESPLKKIKSKKFAKTKTPKIAKKNFARNRKPHDDHQRNRSDDDDDDEVDDDDDVLSVRETITVRTEFFVAGNITK